MDNYQESLLVADIVIFILRVLLTIVAISICRSKVKDAKKFRDENPTGFKKTIVGLTYVASTVIGFAFLSLIWLLPLIPYFVYGYIFG